MKSVFPQRGSYYTSKAAVVYESKSIVTGSFTNTTDKYVIDCPAYESELSELLSVL